MFIAQIPTPFIDLSKGKWKRFNLGGGGSCEKNEEISL